jgi:excisionase family DNA binding protein
VPDSVQTPGREWLDIKALTEYACVSERTLREWIHRSSNPLPAVQVGNKLLVKKSVFDEWLAAYTIRPSANVEAIVEDVMRRLVTKARKWASRSARSRANTTS